MDKSVAQEDIPINERAADAHYDYAPDAVERFDAKSNVFHFRCRNGLALEIYWLNQRMLRLRYAPQGAFEPDFSYAIDPDFKPDTSLLINVVERPHYFLLASESVQCRIEKTDLRATMLDAQGRVLCRDKGGFSARNSILRGKIRLSVSMDISDTDQFYGLGDKACPLRLNGRTFENWNTDAYAFGPGADPLYKTIPFFFGLRDHQAYGIFLDNSFRSRFDFGKTRPDELRFEAAGGEMRYYFLYGPALLDVAAQYAMLTGRPELPPHWALGFHQSRWSYFPETRVMEIAHNFRERRIPCDAIYLDIDYMDGFRCFTWDPNYFPNPEKLIANLRSMGLQTVVMIDPGIKVDPDYAVYNTGLAKDAFCRRSDGDLMTGPVWPGECAFPDFTVPAVREWWGALYQGLYLGDGVAGFWNDMNEPAVFKVSHLTFPDDVLHHYDGHPTNHRKGHNIYGQQMARATYEGLKKLDPRRRPFVLTRATYSGGQRHAATWTGDNGSSWEHLRVAHIQAQRMSVCGYGFCGSDIGGFAGEPGGQLMLRWLQMGVFHPFFRIHSMGNHVSGAAESNPDWLQEEEARHRLDQEPWAFGPQWEELNRQAIGWRYQWLPYLYTALAHWIETGEPVLRSLLFVDQEDPYLVNYEEAVSVGPDVLVYPVFAPDQKSKTIYLPKGEWRYYWNGKYYAGGKKHRLTLRLDQLPVMVRAGTLLPHHHVRQHTGQPLEELILRLYPGPEGKYVCRLYEDAGEGYDYLNGDAAWLRFERIIHADGETLRMERSGAYLPPYRRVKLQWLGSGEEQTIDFPFTEITFSPSA